MHTDTQERAQIETNALRWLLGPAKDGRTKAIQTGTPGARQKCRFFPGGKVGRRPQTKLGFQEKEENSLIDERCCGGRSTHSIISKSNEGCPTVSGSSYVGRGGNNKRTVKTEKMQNERKDTNINGDY